MKVRMGVVALFTTVLVALAVPALAVEVTVQPGNATAQDFPPSSGCGCHGPLVAAWSPSMHAQSIIDPVFLVKVGEAREEAGEEVAVFCRRCHSPIGNMTGDPDGLASDVAGEGVTCMFCHQVTNLDGPPGNTAFLLQPDLTRRAQLIDPAAPHPATYSELHTTAEFCGGCHNVDHPTNGTHLESTYAEWAESSYAAEGVVCQDCHMSSEPGVIGSSTGTACSTGKERDNIFMMSFVGANVGQGPADASRVLLQSAASVELQMPEVVSPGSVATLTVTITNKGAGHYLPTGLTEVRDMWLDVYTKSVDGGVTRIGERRFGTIMRGADGTFPVEMWDAVAVQSDDRIPPRGSVSQDYSFQMPADAESITVFAVLNYRSVPDELAERAGVTNPITEMSSVSQAVFPSQVIQDAAEDGTLEGDSSGPDITVLLIALAIGTVLVSGVVFGIAKLLASRKNR